MTETDTVTPDIESFDDSTLTIDGVFRADRRAAPAIKEDILSASAIEPVTPPVVVPPEDGKLGTFQIEFPLLGLFQEFAGEELACSSISSCEHVEFVGW